MWWAVNCSSRRRTGRQMIHVGHSRVLYEFWRTASQVGKTRALKRESDPPPR